MEQVLYVHDLPKFSKQAVILNSIQNLPESGVARFWEVPDQVRNDSLHPGT
jgi:hypothetical protein